uniref:INTS8 TPR repeats domain-containing protein n=1 Tax=Caenorhabditis japonica TaxID=281687 RepID=A0A8R1DPQ2_CAEJA
MDYPEVSNELSWFECFVDPSVVTQAVSDPEKRKQLPRLCIQFTEKGFLAEKEKDKGKLAIEELMLFERKAASMRLCAMAAFAALDYDIDYIIDNISRNELLTLRVLADNFYKVYNEKNLDATFGNWLFYRFVLSIDRRNRLPPPAPSATVPSTFSNGQLMPSDPALMRYEKVQRMIMELREHVLKARAFITELAEEPRDVVAPGIQCFLKPFVEMAPKSMTAALLGDRNVLIENPHADFEIDKVVLPKADVANKCLSELVQFLFTAGDLVEARKTLQRVVKPTISHPIVAIDEPVFQSYCMILNVRTPFVPANQSTVIKPFVFDQKVLADDNSELRKSELYRYRGAVETSGQLQQVWLSIGAFSYFFRNFFRLCLTRSSDPFWKLMTEYDLGVIKECIAELGPFWFPNTMQVSEFLSGILDPNGSSPKHTLQRILLAKLEQLTRMKNSEGFLDCMKMYFTEFGGSNQWMLLATYESIHVHASIGNYQCFLPYRRQLLDVKVDQALLIFKPDFTPTENSVKLINQCLALMLNFGEAKTVLERGGHLSIEMFKCVPIARILGAYLTNLDDMTAQKKCADGLWRTLTAKLIEAQSRAFRDRGRAAALGAESASSDAKLLAARKDLSTLFHLFDLIHEPRLIEFILAYVVCLHNKLMALQKKNQWMIHAKLLSLYSPDPNAPKLDLPNHDDVRQLLRMMIANAYAGSRTDPDILRTYGDFLYTEKDWQGAGEKYMEYFVSLSPTLQLNAADATIFDEVLLHRLRICLAHSGYLTLSLLVCQWMKASRMSEYQKAMQMLRNNETRDVGANCSGFVTDVTAIELLSQYYQANRMTKSLNTLVLFHFAYKTPRSVELTPDDHTEVNACDKMFPDSLIKYIEQLDAYEQTAVSDDRETSEIVCFRP